MMRVSTWPQIVLLLLLTGCMSLNQRPDTVPVEEAVQPAISQGQVAERPQSEVKVTMLAPATRLIEENSDARIYSLGEAPPVEQRPLSAIDKLTGEAEKLQGEGDLDNAVATLERALRIEPRNPHLWNRLARIRMLQRQFKQAVDLAQRSNALTEKGAAIRHDNWRIIADVRRIDKDFAGAKEADQRAATLQ